jgi:phosphoglycolate phosphatase
MKSYQLIVFDWDGTLMDSTGHIIACMRQAITELALPPLPDSTISQIIGLGLNEAVQNLYPDQGNPVCLALAEQYRQVWLSRPEETPLFDYAQTLLDDLNAQALFLGVATGKSRRGLDRALNTTGLKDHFIATRCADECHSKPHPQMLHEIMDFVGVNGDQTLVIGDTEFDLLMAHNAGADAIGVLTGAHKEHQLQACHPISIQANLEGVHNWLRQQR